MCGEIKQFFSDLYSPVGQDCTGEVMRRRLEVRCRRAGYTAAWACAGEWVAKTHLAAGERSDCETGRGASRRQDLGTLPRRCVAAHYESSSTSALVLMTTRPPGESRWSFPTRPASAWTSTSPDTTVAHTPQRLTSLTYSRRMDDHVSRYSSCPSDYVGSDTSSSCQMDSKSRKYGNAWRRMKAQ